MIERKSSNFSISAGIRFITESGTAVSIGVVIGSVYLCHASPRHGDR